MKAVVCREFGPTDDLEFADVPDPEPAADEVLIAVEASGVNFPDALMVNGTYQVKPERPFIPGSEVAGRIVAVGAQVDGLQVGQRVTAFCGIGGYAELVAVPGARVTPVADNVPFDQAAVLPVAYGTAQHGLINHAALEAGESVLVLGAGGGVGLAAVQLARAHGAIVTAVVSSPEKAAVVAEAGAHRVLQVSPAPAEPSEGKPDALPGLSREDTFDVVVDTVGGAQADNAVRRLAWRGRYLVVGFASGDIPQFRANRVLLNEGRIMGVLWGQWARRNPEVNAAMMRDLAGLLSEGRISPHLHRTFDLSHAAQALREVSGRQVMGKVVLGQPTNDEKGQN